MSQIHALGKTEHRRDPARLLVLLTLTAERLRHPVRSYRGLRARLLRTQYPSITTMTDEQFAAYARRTGIEAQLTRTLSKAGGMREDQAGADGRVQAPAGRPQP